MAETASLLVPEKRLIGMKDIQTYQWIDVEQESTTLQISARRKSSDASEIEVRVHNLGASGQANAGKGFLAIQGVMVFGESYPEAPPVKPLSLTDARTPEFTAEHRWTMEPGAAAWRPGGGEA